MKVRSPFFVLLFIITASRGEQDPNTPGSDSYDTAAKQFRAECDRFETIVAMNRTRCFLDYLDVECLCFLESLDEISKEMGIAIDPMGCMKLSCSNGPEETKTGTDFMARLLQLEYKTCLLKPDRIVQVIKNALDHCTTKCYRN